MVPDASPGGRPRRAASRELINAILDMLRGGLAWRLLPHDFSPWQTDHDYLRRWQARGVWERIHHAVLVADRERVDRDKRQAIHRRRECESLATTWVSCFNPLASWGAPHGGSRIGVMETKDVTQPDGKPDKPTKPPATGSPGQAGHHPITSQDLLAGQRERIIRHGTEEYRLRLTGNNKLILTK